MLLSKTTSPLFLFFCFFASAVSAFMPWRDGIMPSKLQLRKHMCSKDCQLQYYKTSFLPEALHLEELTVEYIKVEHYQFHSMSIINCNINKFGSSAINSQSYHNTSPNYHRKSELFNELSTQSKSISNLSIICSLIQRMKSTKFAWIYLFLATFYCHSAIKKSTQLIPHHSSKQVLNFYQHDARSNDSSEKLRDIPSNTSSFHTYTSITSTSGSTNYLSTSYESIEKSSANTSCAIQTSGTKKQDQSTDQNKEAQENQHQRDVQQPNTDADNESDDIQDRQGNHGKDGQQDDDDEDGEKDNEEDDENGEEEDEEEEEEEEITQDEQKKKCLVNKQDKTGTCRRITSFYDSLHVKEITVKYPVSKQTRAIPYPQHRLNFGRPIPEMLKPSKSKHLGMKRPSSPNGFVSVDRILSEKAEIHFKKVYDRKCKQQQDERINSVDDLAVSTEPYDINLLDRKFYYNADGTDNLYDGPEEIAAKLGLEYKGSHIVAVLLSTRKFHASRGSSVAVNISKQRTARASIASGAIITSSGSSSLPQSPSKVVTERAIPKDDKLKNAGVLTRITLAAYKEERRRKVLGTWSALKQ